MIQNGLKMMKTLMKTLSIDSHTNGTDAIGISR